MAKINVVPPVPVEPTYNLELTAAEASALRNFLGAFRIADVDNKSRDLRQIWDALNNKVPVDWEQHDDFLNKIRTYSR